MFKEYIHVSFVFLNKVVIFLSRVLEDV
jgi:hypothetical protein